MTALPARIASSVASLFAVLLVGCSAAKVYLGTKSATGDQGSQTFVYECESGDTVVVQVEGNSAWVFGPSGTLELQRVASNSGSRFGNAGSSYWSEHQKAQFVFNQRVLTDCLNNRARAIWEDAKLRGVDFRAVGNEPGWHLEIHDQDRIVFVNDYGRDRYLFPAPDPRVDPVRRVTRYQLDYRRHRLTVQLVGEPCTDSMSGEVFATRVTLIIDGTPLAGCGRALH